MAKKPIKVGDALKSNSGHTFKITQRIGNHLLAQWENWTSVTYLFDKDGKYCGNTSRDGIEKLTEENIRYYSLIVEEERVIEWRSIDNSNLSAHPGNRLWTDRPRGVWASEQRFLVRINKDNSTIKVMMLKQLTALFDEEN